MIDIEEALRKAKLKPPTEALDRSVEHLLSSTEQRAHPWYRRRVPLWVAIAGCGLVATLTLSASRPYVWKSLEGMQRGTALDPAEMARLIEEQTSLTQAVTELQAQIAAQELELASVEQDRQNVLADLQEKVKQFKEAERQFKELQNQAVLTRARQERRESGDEVLNGLAGGVDDAGPPRQAPLEEARELHAGNKKVLLDSITPAADLPIREAYAMQRNLFDWAAITSEVPSEAEQRRLLVIGGIVGEKEDGGAR